ncbi:MAG: type II secretion system protein N, partial [Sulfurifustaceae bacterium]
LALLSFTLARGTWRLLTPPQSVAETPPAVVNENPGDYNLQALLSANVFGQVAPTAAKGSVSLDAIPLSSLNLVLSGVMVTSAGSFALISADGNPELPFGVGQEIVAGVTLYAVYGDRVLIRRGGATETLMLKDISPDLAKGSIVTSAPPSANVDSSGINPNSSRARRRERNRQFFIDRQQLNQQMQQPEVLSQALMVPNAGGGFLVREIQPGSVYEKFGLKVGDVIASVNGHAVNTMDDVMRLYQQVASTSNLQINVKRAGRNETLVYNIQ